MGEYNFDASAIPSDLSKRDQQLFTKSEPTQDYEDIKKATKDFVKAVGEKYADSSSIQGERAHSDGPLPSGWSAGEEDRTRSSSTKATEPVFMKKAKTDDVGFGGLDQDHYAECYPGGMEEVDATVNSDDEIDFSKMDVGNRMETISHQGKHYQKLLSSIALKWMTVVRLVDKVSRMRKLKNGSRSVRFFKKESQVKQSLIPSASRL